MTIYKSDANADFNRHVSSITDATSRVTRTEISNYARRAISADKYRHTAQLGRKHMRLLDPESVPSRGLDLASPLGHTKSLEVRLAVGKYPTGSSNREAETPNFTSRLLQQITTHWREFPTSCNYFPLYLATSCRRRFGRDTIPETFADTKTVVIQSCILIPT